MRCHWERLGVLSPIYELVGQGLGDRAIAGKLKLTEVTVQGCVSWLLRSFNCHNRAELVLYASPAERETWGLHAG